MKVEAQLRADIGVGELFVRKLDGKADGFASRFGGAAIGGFHDTGTSTGANDEAARPRTQGHGPGGDSTRELTRFFVVARHFQQTFCATDGGAMFYAVDGGGFMGRGKLQTGLTSPGQITRQDTRRTEHDDSVADAFFL